MSEKILQRQIVSLLRQRGIVPLVHRMDRRTGATVGWPDLTFCAKGDGYLWEVKTQSGRLSLEQEQMMDALSQPPNQWNVRAIRSLDEAVAELHRKGL